MQSWLSAQEIADLAKRLNYSGFPTTKRGVQDLARREEWNSNADLCRKRKGRGGGFEYHISLLPEILRAGAMAESGKQIVAKDHAQTRALQDQKRAALTTSELSARQRQVMDARAAILTAIDTRQIHDGSSRFQAIKTFLLLPTECGITHDIAIIANDRANQSAKLSKTSIYRWYAARDEIGVAALAPLKTRKKQPAPDWFGGFLHHYARPQKPCISEALREFERELGIGGFVPSYDQVARLVRQMDDISKNKGRERPLTLKARMAYVSRTTDDLLPTTIYTADGKTFDAEVQHPFHGGPFKPEITSIIDVATRKCVGFSIGLAENAEGVIDALRRSIETHGIPAIFYADRGAGFKNKKLEDPLTGLLERLGITAHHSLPRNSQARGIIERFNQTAWNALARQYATYLGREMDMEASQSVHKRSRRDMKEFGTSRLLKPWAEFMADCYQSIEEYNSRIHSTLKRSPNTAWHEHVQKGFEPVTLHAHEGDDLFRSYEVRKANRGLIKFNTNDYFSLELERYNGKQVMVGYDIHDASKVWVREIEMVAGEQRSGRLICIAEFNGNAQRYVPLTMQRKAEEVRANARKQRLDVKYDEVEAELNPASLLDAPSIQPMDIVEPRHAQPTTIDHEPKYPTAETSPSAKVVRPLRFASDEELAAWAIEHPNGLASSQIEVLRKCLNSQARLEIMKMSGIDVDRLRDVVRAAA
ncbi:Mu transposase C-terminal domain-containing protein [Maritalea porphyrae]|uniref:Mu transposase C-terminal domain-containing protein n=1 Tax=Maritalea porphyrae TaxID=880732 RepID=UPI0022AEAD53|nr:Mu transposase C-terminal domain-containing protein [Maritalea porphyrae]MCZ4273332.1 Mu transposase C-terminal domain-containing protein [Maritalea porphyrae]